MLRAGPGSGDAGADGDAVLGKLVEELEGVMVDPRAHERVVFTLTVRGVWGGEGPAAVGGWRRAADGTLVFDDGIPVPAGWATDVQAVDFPAALAAEYAGQEGGEDDVFARMELNASGLAAPQHVASAVWARLIGKAELSRRALAKARDGLRGEETLADDWRQSRAWFYYAGMVHGYMHGMDDEARIYGGILLRHYRETAARHHSQAEQLMRELERRRERGPVPEPGELSERPVEERIDALIDGLDGILVYQDGQPGGVNLGEDERVRALVEIGDPAVPKLLDVIEHDTRLTRSVHFWRAHHPSRTVLGVHEAALTAVMSILRTEFFDAASTGDNFTGRGDEGRRKVAAQLRAYWERYGGERFDERMMTILRDPGVSPEARREAGWNLATPRARQIIGTTVWTGSFEPGKGGNAGITKFNAPTIAEALLLALDDELEGIARKERASPPKVEREGSDDPFAQDYRGDDPPGHFDGEGPRRRAVEEYTGILQELGDRRIGPVLAERASRAEDVVLRCDFALAADQLGDSSAVQRLTRLLVDNALEAPEGGDEPAMFAVFWCLSRAQWHGAVTGLMAVADSRHAWYPSAVELVLQRSDPFGGSGNRCRRHVWALAVLEAALHDESRSEFRSIVRWDKREQKWEVFRREPNGNGGLGDGSPFLDETKFEREWQHRQCDRAAEQLLRLLGDHEEGTFEPLAKDRDEMVERLRRHMQRYRDRFRDLEQWVDGGTGWAIEDGRFLPVLPALGRAATPEDVAAGLALFTLDSPGTPPDLVVPVAAEWLGRSRSGWIVGGDPDAPESRDVVVLQVERDAQGMLWFGVADGNGFHVVPSPEIGAMEVIPGAGE